VASDVFINAIAILADLILRIINTTIGGKNWNELPFAFPKN